jgi:hypothetical protein
VPQVGTGAVANDRAGLADPLQARGDIDAIAHEIAVGLLDDVAEMNAKRNSILRSGSRLAWLSATHSAAQHARRAY